MRSNKSWQSSRLAIAALTVTLAGAGWFPRIGVSHAGSRGGSDDPDLAPAGTVYTMTNASSNEVLAYTRATNGTLTSLGSYATEGAGTGNNLYSQGSVILNADHTLLFVVNSSSNQITSFTVQPDGSLVFADIVGSNGVLPVSLTSYGNLLYVVNNGTYNISGFEVSSGGVMTLLQNSSLPLSSPMARPGEISFDTTGTILAVTEKATGKIDTFTVGSDGLPTGPLVQNSNGPEPFGFAFDVNDDMIVSEGANSTVSSYAVSAGGVLTVVSGSVTDTQKQACWVANTSNPAFPSVYSYISNTGTGTISSFTVSKGGALTLLAAKAGVGVADARDMAISVQSKYLYVFGRSAGKITGYTIHMNGSLTEVTTATSIPTTSYGLAGY